MVQRAPEKFGQSGGQLLSAAKEIQQILDALPFYVLLVDSGHRIIAANYALRQDIGFGSEQVIGAYCPLTVHGWDIPSAECPLVEAVEKGELVERDVFNSQNGRWVKLAVYPTQLVTADGKPIYLHFARDITNSKNTADELARSLEHHSALCGLLQNLQYCQSSAHILEVLIDKIISLSWLGMASTAVGFLVGEKDLEIAAQRNLSPKQVKRCAHLELGECLCGMVAQTGSPMVCSSTCEEHTIKYEGMEEHRHAVLPLRHEDRVLGVLTLYLKSGDALDAFRFDFLRTAVSAAAAALSAQLAREEVKRTREKSLAQMISYQEDERKRIARDLHDQVCQSLSALLLEMQAHGSQHESLRGIQAECESRVRSIIDEVRKMAGQLRPTILDDYGLEMALARHVEELSARTDLVIDYQYVSSQEGEARLPAPIEVSLYRVALEALNNILSHASASRASVIVLWKQTKVLLLVEDDGCGFDYPAKRKDMDHCHGLIGMEERIDLMGGTLKIESIPQKGTTLRAEIPIQTVH